MSNGNDSAYPSIPQTATSPPQRGLTKREYIATHAMEGLMHRVWRDGTRTDDEIIKQWAKSAVLCADALLAELEKAP